MVCERQEEGKTGLPRLALMYLVIVYLTDSSSYKRMSYVYLKKKCFQEARSYLVHTVSAEAHSVCHKKTDKQYMMLCHTGAEFDSTATGHISMDPVSPLQ